MNTYRDIFETELARHNLRWCKGGCAEQSSHKRGFVLVSDKCTVHYDSAIATRKTLHGGLHEIGHCINDEHGLRSYEREAAAEAFATRRLRELGVAVPRDTVMRGKAYIARKKRHGDRVHG